MSVLTKFYSEFVDHETLPREAEWPWHASSVLRSYSSIVFKSVDSHGEENELAVVPIAELIPDAARLDGDHESADRESLTNEVVEAANEWADDRAALLGYTVTDISSGDEGTLHWDVEELNPIRHVIVVFGDDQSNFSGATIIDSTTAIRISTTREDGTGEQIADLIPSELDADLDALDTYNVDIEGMNAQYDTALDDLTEKIGEWVDEWFEANGYKTKNTASADGFLYYYAEIRSFLKRNPWGGKPEPMTPAEMLVVREFLGLNVEELAAFLGVQTRTVRRWHEGSTPVPDGVRERIEALERDAADLAQAGITAQSDGRDPHIVVYRTDEELWAVEPDTRPFPARFHRAITARIAQEVPGLSIIFPPK